MAWADALTVGSFCDWRLPLAQASCRFNCTASELDHLWHSELGNALNGLN